MKAHDVTRSLGLAVAAALVLAACKGQEAESATPDAPVSVAIGAENIAIVTQGEISSGPAISGALAPEREATVRAQVPGAVLKVNVDQGMRVGSGQSLAQIDDRTMRDAFLSARVDLGAIQRFRQHPVGVGMLRRVAGYGAVLDRGPGQHALRGLGAGRAALAGEGGGAGELLGERLPGKAVHRSCRPHQPGSGPGHRPGQDRRGCA